MASSDELPELFERYRSYLRVLVEIQASSDVKAKLDLSGIVQQSIWEACQAALAGAAVDVANPLPWLRRILAHNLADEIRKCEAQKRAARREVSLQHRLDHSSMRLEALLADSTPSPSMRVARDEQMLALTAALCGLPGAQREALTLQHWQGLSLQEIAERMGRTPVAVAGLLKRALRSLRQKLDQST